MHRTRKTTDIVTRNLTVLQKVRIFGHFFRSAIGSITPRFVKFYAVGSKLGPRWQRFLYCLRQSLTKWLIFLSGWVAERLKAPVLKTGRGASSSWVRIPPHPPVQNKAANVRDRRCCASGCGRRPKQISLRAEGDLAGCDLDSLEICGPEASSLAAARA